jgi:hypothetical protein
MTDYIINERIKKIYSKMHVDGSCYRVCCMTLICRPGVRGFVMVISYSLAKDNALSNKQWKDSLQFLRISPTVSTKSLA